LLTIDPEERIEWSDFFGHSIFKRRESPENLNKMLERKKTRYITTYKEFDEATEYVKNNPDFKFSGKRPQQLMEAVHVKDSLQSKDSDAPEIIEAENKKVEEKSACCAVF